MRELLDWLRDSLIPIYEKEISEFLVDPWEARNNYIDIILDRTSEHIEYFIQENAKHRLSDREITTVLRLMEMQRNAQLMYTSCAWFFDEISGIETNQVLQYALRAINYAKQVTDIDLHPEFLERLKQTPSNIYENGAVSYEKEILPTQLTLERVGMHYAITSLFEDNPDDLSLFNYEASNLSFEKNIAGNYRLITARTIVQSKITLSKKTFSFAVLYLGQQNIIGNISTDLTQAQFLEAQEVLKQEFLTTDLGRVIGSMQSFFKSDKFSIWHLFRDEKRQILDQVTKKSLAQVEHGFREIYDDNYQLMTGMLKSQIPIPNAYKSAIQHIANTDLHRFFEQDILKIQDLKRLSREIDTWNLNISDPQALKFAAGERIFYEIQKINHMVLPTDQIQVLVDIIQIFNELDLELDIWKSQNHYFSLLEDFLSGKNNFPNHKWKDTFLNLGRLLKVNTSALSMIGIMNVIV